MLEYVTKRPIRGGLVGGFSGLAAGGAAGYDC